MRAYQIMTPRLTTVRIDTPIAKAAELMLEKRVSGLPVVDAKGHLVGIVSEGDFLRRGEIGTRHRRSGWLEFFVGPGKLASEFVKEEGRTVGDVMTRDPVTIAEDATLEDIVQIMEQKGIKRLPVLRNGDLIGIVTRANLLQAVANLARDASQPSTDDDTLRKEILNAIESQPWSPMGLNAVVRDGIVDLSGVITDDRQRNAVVVAAKNVPGVKAVHDHMCWVDTMSGFYVEAPSDQKSS
ncbi:MAG: CBS domain-containing protein [Xanthobacteraceae bacterium]